MEITAEHGEMERGRIFGIARRPYLAVLSPVGCALFGGFLPRISQISRMEDGAF
jgi:hypothetical protein